MTYVYSRSNGSIRAKPAILKNSSYIQWVVLTNGRYFATRIKTIRVYRGSSALGRIICCIERYTIYYIQVKHLAN